MIIIAIVALIVGILTIKNMKTETEPGVERAQTMEKAKDAARQADDATKRIQEAAKKAEMPSLE